jgi:3-methyladenine DNA glycosylase AlkD
MSTYLTPLVSCMEAVRNAERAAQMSAYMREQFPFLGVQAPRRRAVLRSFLATYGPPPIAELDDVIRVLWATPEGEYQYVGADLLNRMRRQLTPAHVPLLEFTLTTRPWWDTVDTLAAHPVAALFKGYPQTRAETVAHWRAEPGIWLRRTVLLFQLLCKDKTDVDLLFSLINDNLSDTEFFIQKAIGWGLRQYSKTDQTAVTAFVAATNLSPLAEREALKWLQNQGRI